MTSSGSSAELLGRGNECRALDELLVAVRTGRSATVVLRGEAGIGKTELLRYVRERATGCHIVTATGVQSEMEISYAGLHQLCRPDGFELEDGEYDPSLGQGVITTAGKARARAQLDAAAARMTPEKFAEIRAQVGCRMGRAGGARGPERVSSPAASDPPERGQSACSRS